MHCRCIIVCRSRDVAWACTQVNRIILSSSSSTRQALLINRSPPPTNSPAPANGQWTSTARQLLPISRAQPTAAESSKRSARAYRPSASCSEPARGTGRGASQFPPAWPASRPVSASACAPLARQLRPGGAIAECWAAWHILRAIAHHRATMALTLTGTIRPCRYSKPTTAGGACMPSILATFSVVGEIKNMGLCGV